MPYDARIEPIATSLVQSIAQFPSVVVAFSGGVDSAVVASAAFRALAEDATAWTGIGAALPQSDRDAARRVAESIGIRHVVQMTEEINNPEYVRNASDRCFHCKSTLYSSIRAWADANAVAAILSGTNHDDLADYRPGLEAAAEWKVLSPLADLGIGKAQVRAIAAYWGLEVADKPASPCLASRIAYGQTVTLGRLRSIETIEVWLADRGFRDVRARVHADKLLRLELAIDQLPMAIEPGLREELLKVAASQGFQFVTIDLAGRVSGSLNRALALPNKKGFDMKSNP